MFRKFLDDLGLPHPENALAVLHDAGIRDDDTLNFVLKWDDELLNNMLSELQQSKHLTLVEKHAITQALKTFRTQHEKATK
jgi:hypothetical protein